LTDYKYVDTNGKDGDITSTNSINEAFRILQSRINKEEDRLTLLIGDNSKI